MSPAPLRGVIAAIATPIDPDGEPDVDRLVAHARDLFDAGCDGLNLLGTTGEATSFTVAQRGRLMQAVATSGLPVERMMVGTGAAAVGDAVALSAIAAELGFAGALVLPPFYYKPVSAEGIANYIAAIVTATKSALPLYLYNFPALTGITYTPEIVASLLEQFGSRIAGLKDSSGDLPYARSVAGLSETFAVFPSNEATLPEARSGVFAGCISATANLNAADCARAFRHGDAPALQRATRVRGMFDGVPLVPGIKQVLAWRRDDHAWQRMTAPLTPLDADVAVMLRDRVRALDRTGA